MKKYVQTIFVVILSITIFIKCGEQKKDEATEMMQKKIDQFAVTELKYDDSILTENEKVVVQKLYEAGKIIDEIFLEQVYSKNFELRETLQKSTELSIYLILCSDLSIDSTATNHFTEQQQNRQARIFILKI